MDVDYAIEVTHNFERCVELIQKLSLPGKIALVRGLAELLAVSLGIVPATTPTSPSLPTLPPPHPENAWCGLSLEEAICFCKAGHMNPAILLWVFSVQSLQSVAPELLVQALEQFAGLKEALEGGHSCN